MKKRKCPCGFFKWVAVLLCLLGSSAFATDFSGEWSGNWNSYNGNSGWMAVSLTQNGSALTGSLDLQTTYYGNFYDIPLTGSVSGGTAIVVGTKVEPGLTYRVEYTWATLSADGSASEGNYTITLNGVMWDYGTFSVTRPFSGASSTLPLHHVLYLDGFNGAGLVRMNNYVVLSTNTFAEVYEDLSAAYFKYSLNWLNSTTVRVRVEMPDEPPYTVVDTFDLTFTSDKAGTLSNYYNIQYQYGIEVNRWGKRNGIFTLEPIPVQNCTITTASSPSAGGTVSGGGSKALLSYCTVTAAANSGYQFFNWTTGSSVVSTSAIYSFAVTGDRTLTANFTDSRAVTEAMDQPTLAMTYGGTKSWYSQTAITHDGIDAVRSGTVTHNQDSWMQATLTGPGTLTYWWKVSSESGYDFLEFYLDGVLQTGRISGTVDWQQKTYSITGGTHTAKWRYMKDSGVSSGTDAGWVDQVSFSGVSRPLVATAAPSGITGTGATLNGTVNPNGATTTARFEYGLTTNYGSTASVTLSPANGTTVQTVSKSISGLQVGQLYHYRLTATNSGGASQGGDMTVVTTTTTPKIVVEQASGISLTSGGTVNFGDVGPSDSSRITFTVKNIGNASLTGLSVSKDGSDSSAFWVPMLGANSLAPGATTTFSITFEQDYIGTHSAAIHLASNDPTGNPFNLNLTGKGVAAGLYSYEVINGEVTITSCTNSTGALRIPAALAGMPVTGIGGAAFYACTGLTSVSIPDGLESIGDHAFAGCTGLTGFTIPASVTSIAYGAFAGCTGISAITVADGNPYYCSVDGVLFYIDLTGLLQYPAGKTGAYAIPDSVEYIDDCAFEGCSGLTGVSIPSSVYWIGNSPFAGCTGLPAITVADGNPYYCSVDGVLFDIDLLTLIQYPAGRIGAYTIPDSVDGIGVNAFEGCHGLTSVSTSAGLTYIPYGMFEGCAGLTNVSIHAGVTTIGGLAFSGCTGLASVRIPDSVTTIEYYAFDGCTALTSVSIPASVEEISSSAFGHCTGLVSAYFMGAAPWLGGGVFDDVAAAFRVYYRSGQSGFTTPLWEDYPAYPLATTQEITVIGPSGTELVNNGAGVNFGIVGSDLSWQKTFTILNAGTLNLTGLAITKNGTHAADFSVGPLGSTTLAAGASTTFTVTFRPGAAGTRTAAIHLASNDSNENPFDMALTGTGSTVSVSAALDQPGLILTAGGTAPWVSQTATTHDGVDAARSGTITDNQESWLQTTLTGPGILTYWWKVSSEGGCDYLEFYLDGVYQNSISGEVDWQQQTYSIASGLHAVKWRYVKDSTASSGTDAGWLDQVSFATSPLVTTTSASGITATNATLNGTVNPNGAATTAQFEYGLTTAYGSTADVTLSPSNGTTTQTVSAVISGLQAGQTYHYRLTATNSCGAGTGADMTLVTLQLPGAVPFAQWLIDRGLTGSTTNLFVQDRNGDGVPNGFEYAFGTNRPAGEPVLKIRRTADGRMIAEIPGQDGTTTPYVQIRLVGSTNLIDWTLPVELATNTSGKPASSSWYESEGVPPGKAFFKLEAELK